MTIGASREKWILGLGIDYRSSSVKLRRALSILQARLNLIEAFHSKNVADKF